tara:strand:+ start:170 stop:784 length:615 start_codon:yes stop_codon:yes gene_type:complete
MFKLIIKKLLWITILGLLLSGCFKNKSEVAIENCADDNVDYVSLYIDTPLFDHFKKNKQYNKLSNQLQNKTDEYQANRSRFENLIQINYLNYEKILAHYKDYHYGVSDDLIHPDADYDYVYRRAKTKIDRVLAILESEGMAEQLLDSRLIMNKSSLKLLYFVRDKFKEENLKTKFLLERYSKYYQKCELEYNKTPKTFIAEWGR